MSIPLQLVTGFLGSGKTSFLKHYLPVVSVGRKVAIIQNEFSPVNIDGQELKADFSCEMLEINNGSVFCVCLLGSFIDSLNQFLDQVKPDLVLMEASGLSDPLGVGQVFQAEKLRGRIYLDRVWCLVDARHFNQAPALQLRLEHQLRSADVILLNKLDLLNKSPEELAKQVQQINPFASVLKASYGQIDDYDQSAKHKFFPAEKPIEGRPDLESVVIRSSHKISSEALQQFLAKLNGSCVRAKGFVQLKDGRQGFLQAVFEDVELSFLDSKPVNTELVFIGKFAKNANLQVLFDEYCRL